MATLTGRTPASSYKDLLQVSNSNSGIDATLRDVSDGEGTAGAFQISTTGVSSTGTHAFGGVMTSTDATESTSTSTGAFNTAGGLGVVKTIVAGLGIKLGGTAAANLLDDYEEGTWTPVISDASSGGNVAATASKEGTYTKIGDTVNIQVDAQNINTAGMTAGNAVFIQGLPFTSISSAGHDAVCPIILSFTTFTGSIVAKIDDAATIITLLEQTSGNNVTNLIVSSMTSGSADLFIQATYRV